MIEYVEGCWLNLNCWIWKIC